MTGLHSASALDMVANWQARLRHLKSALLEAPEHSFAWRWRIQIKVLTFLLSRYGDVSLSPESPAPISSPLFFCLNASVYERYPLRSSTQMRQALDRIAEINMLKER